MYFELSLLYISTVFFIDFYVTLFESIAIDLNIFLVFALLTSLAVTLSAVLVIVFNLFSVLNLSNIRFSLRLILESLNIESFAFNLSLFSIYYLISVLNIFFSSSLGSQNTLFLTFNDILF